MDRLAGDGGALVRHVKVTIPKFQPCQSPVHLFDALAVGFDFSIGRHGKAPGLPSRLGTVVKSPPVAVAT